MSQRATFSLETENYAFLNLVGGSNKSAYINSLLEKERRLALENAVFKANQEEQSDLAYQEELDSWNVTLSDGLSDV